MRRLFWYDDETTTFSSYFRNRFVAMMKHIIHINTLIVQKWRQNYKPNSHDTPKW